MFQTKIALLLLIVLLISRLPLTTPQKQRSVTLNSPSNSNTTRRPITTANSTFRAEHCDLVTMKQLYVCLVILDLKVNILIAFWVLSALLYLLLLLGCYVKVIYPSMTPH